MPTLSPITRAIAAVVVASSLWTCIAAARAGEWLTATLLAVLAVIAGYALVSGRDQPPRA